MASFKRVASKFVYGTVVYGAGKTDEHKTQTIKVGDKGKMNSFVFQ